MGNEIVFLESFFIQCFQIYDVEKLESWYTQNQQQQNQTIVILR